MMTPERRAAVETVIDLWIAEGGPSDYRTAACNLWDECEELRAALAAAEAKLADERLHADALAKAVGVARWDAHHPIGALLVAHTARRSAEVKP